MPRTALTLPSRRDPIVRRIAHDWRRLTSPESAGRAGPGERTLIACSAGADSSALAIALTVAAGKEAPRRLAVGHIVHDLRPAAESLADRDAARALADRLDLPFLEAAIAVRSLPGNAEALARRERYRALAALARDARFPFIATGHHAHDQLETALITLLRGSGPRGWRAIAERRRLGHATLIRPMLAVGPAESRDLCREAGWHWQMDQTNSDQSRLRAAIRARVVPALVDLRPSAPAHARTLARHAAHLHDLIDAAARALGPPPWPRAALRAANPLAVGEALRRATRAVTPPADRRRDGPPARAIQAAVRAIASTDRATLEIHWTGARIVATAKQVRIEPLS